MFNILTEVPFAISSVCRTLLCILLLGSISSLLAQKTDARKAFDPVPLRSQFASAAGKDFEIVKDELKQRSNARGGGSYWLVHMKPRHSGYFALTHRYNYNDSHYSHVEREFNLNVGPRGCRRGPPSTGSYSRFCVGDTIILPIVINNFSEHQFSLKSQEYTQDSDAVFDKAYRAGDEGLVPAQISNPVADYLRYVGSSSYKMLHRNGGYTLEAQATFVAEHPGRFNLALSTAFKNMPADLPARVSDANSIPIIIVARDTPVTLLASRHEVRGYSKGYDGREYVSSTSGDAFMTQLIILQPGDRISLKYHTSTRSREFEWKERSRDSQHGDSPEEAPLPLIAKHPFALQSEYNFTEWLVDYLPR